MTATKTFPIFDCDSHIVEPPEIWDEYVPASVRTWAKTARRLYGIDPVLVVTERIVDHQPAILAW